MKAKVKKDFTLADGFEGKKGEEIEISSSLFNNLQDLRLVEPVKAVKNESKRNNTK